MTRLELNETVGQVVARQPALAPVFERHRIDYCCGGKKTLAAACREAGRDPQQFLEELLRFAHETEKPPVDPAAMTLTDLADHIEQTHHRYLREELPRIKEMAAKVASVHGEMDPRLPAVHETFLALMQELTSHMMKEESILFPMIRMLEAGTAPPAFHCGSIANPMNQMEMEHQHAGSALALLRELTGDYRPPEWGCNTYRVLLHALAFLEEDLHLHIHKENNVLFPRALRLERVPRLHSPTS